MSMGNGKIMVIEDYADNGEASYGVSLKGPNPADRSYIEAFSADEAKRMCNYLIKLKELENNIVDQFMALARESLPSDSCSILEENIIPELKMIRHL